MNELVESIGSLLGMTVAYLTFGLVVLLCLNSLGLDIDITFWNTFLTSVIIYIVQG